MQYLEKLANSRGLGLLNLRRGIEGNGINKFRDSSSVFCAPSEIMHRTDATSL